jgi:hypothetical protein
MSQVEAVLMTGEETIASFLARADALGQVIAGTFPDKPLDAVEAEMAGLVTIGSNGKPGSNAVVTKLVALVRAHSAMAQADFKKAEMWLYLKQPSISDGNNFGVDVQNYVLEQLKGMRESLTTMVNCVADYHWQRASGLDKLPGEKKEETTSSESTDVEGDKTTKKASNGSKTTATMSAPVEDYVKYVAALDTKQYHSAFCQLTDLQNCYIKAHVLFERNAKRLRDPRGEGSSGDRGNVMSMF